MNKTTKTIAYTAIFVAMSYLATTFLSFPIGGGAAYLNLGDAVILVSAVVLGPIPSLIVGLLGPMLADLTLGFFAFIPFTIIAKGGEGLIAGLLFKSLHYKISFLGFILSSLFMVAVYFGAYWWLYQNAAFMYSGFDLIQLVINVSITCILVYTYKAVFKPKIEKDN